LLLTLTRPPSCARAHTHTHTHTTLHHRHHHFDTILCPHVKHASFLLWSSSTHAHSRYVPCGPGCGDPRDLSGGNAGGLPGAVKISVVGGCAADGNPRLLLWAWDPIVKVMFCTHLLDRLAGPHIRQPSSLVHTTCTRKQQSCVHVYGYIHLTSRRVIVLLLRNPAHHQTHTTFAHRRFRCARLSLTSLISCQSYKLVELTTVTPRPTQRRYASHCAHNARPSSHDRNRL
jgi:hypothetical protein